MIVKRKEKWGILKYDTKKHNFIYNFNKNKEDIIYPTQPLVLNVDLTFKCNMACVHCVAKDMANILGGVENADLKVTDELISKINASPFMVIVITGGEPLLYDYEERLIRLIKNLKNKGIILDTNGTIFPSSDLIELFKLKNVLVRVSWDIPHPRFEAKLRKYPKKLYEDNSQYINNKIDIIKLLVKSNVMVAVQSVIHKYNYNNINFYNFPHKLKELKVYRWYIQRFIPSYLCKHKEMVVYDKSYTISDRINDACEIAKSLGIKCHYKRDRRHNSVFLLVKDGILYTQSDKKPGEKIELGKIGEIDYFSRVSAPDHGARYFT